MVVNEEKKITQELPEGFENNPGGEAKYKEIRTQSGGPQVNFGRPGGGPGRGGPGRGMMMATEKPKEGRKTIGRLVKYFGHEKALLVFLIISVIMVTLASLAAPSLQGDGIDVIKNTVLCNKIIKFSQDPIGSPLSEQDLDDISKQAVFAGVADDLAAGKPVPTDTIEGIKLALWDDIINTLILLMGVYLVSVIFSLVQSLMSANLSQRIVKRMRYDLFKKIDNLAIKYLDSHSNGDIMSRMTNDVENISNTVSQSLGSLVSGVLTIIGTVTIMFIKCWQLTLITMLSVIVTVIITRWLSKIMRKIFRKRSAVLGRLNGHSEEMITGYKSVVAYNKQRDMVGEFNETSDELMRVSMKAQILGGSMGPIMNCISNFSFVIVAAFGGWFAVSHGDVPALLSIGTISAFIIYAKQFSRPINEIAMLYSSIQTAIAGAERVFEIIDRPDEDNSGDIPLETIRGEISFRNVNFSYTPEKQVIKDFSLEVHPGQKIALVGATGSGKTTIVNLLMRFYPVDSGEILIDGVSITDIKRDDLRRNAAIVLQDTVLFSDTIENNIKYANQDADHETVRNAAIMSNSAEFIERLPQQYDSYLYQAGANLSQGQRQLIAIARAVLADPKILILDEATSSVDTRTEKNIQDAMIKLMENRTSLIIAHRLSTIRDADLIVVMDKGQVVEKGNHDELLERKGRYYELYMTQFAGKDI